MGSERNMECSTSEKLSRSDEVLLDSVLEWYNEEHERVDNFLAIVKRKNGMSLRVIDWLVTNFSKTNSVILEKGGIPRDLNRDYQKNLSAYNKRNMDPFARRNKIIIMIYGKESRTSTVGQLNFFRWFLKNDIIGFLRENKGVVENHMKDAESKIKGKNRRANKSNSKSKSYVGKFKMVF